MARTHQACIYALIAALALLFSSLPALAQEVLGFESVPGEIRPGKPERISFTLPRDGLADITLEDREGATAAAPMREYEGEKGINYFTWDGQYFGSPVAAGDYTLRLAFEGESVTVPISIGSGSPVLSSATASHHSILPGEKWEASFTANMEGVLRLALVRDGVETLLKSQKVALGPGTISWDGMAGGEPAAPGEYMLTLSLSDAQGYESAQERFPLTIEDAAPVSLAAHEEGAAPAPADSSDYSCGHENCYWKLPMDIQDEEAVWNVLIQPMTILKGGQRQVIKLRAQPSADSQAVGEVTCDSQGVHVLETLNNGWTLVEAYSSSPAKSTVKVYAEFVKGYVKTELLEVKEASTLYGIVIDKLNQQLYLFKEGKLFSQMPICTGLVNKRQPFNETPAGEFMVVSWTGGFWSGNMYCDKALRINAGILLHEVPCFIDDNGNRSHGYFEKVLGQKASHGCIRVPQQENEQGVNMKYLWDNLKMNTKVLIWEDSGRDLPIPDSSLPMYYNTDGGKYYHADQYCSSVRDKYLPLTGFSYGELEEEPYAALTACPSCKPPQKAGEIEEYNRNH